jgi:N-acetyl-beta-hexosaminidase
VTNPRAELTPSDRALLNEAIDLLCGCAPMAWIAKDLNDAAEYEKQITAFIARVRTLDAAAPAQAGEWVTVPREATEAMREAFDRSASMPAHSR